MASVGRPADVSHGNGFDAVRSAAAREQECQKIRQKIQEHGPWQSTLLPNLAAWLAGNASKKQPKPGSKRKTPAPRKC